MYIRHDRKDSLIYIYILRFEVLYRNLKLVNNGITLFSLVSENDANFNTFKIKNPQASILYGTSNSYV